MRRVVMLLVFIPISTIYLCAQPSFQQLSGQWKKHLPTRSVIPGAIVDINGDLIDDIVALDKGTKAIYLESRGKFIGFTPLDTISVSANPEWTLACGDLNNDGIPEIMTAGEYGPVSVLQWDNTSQSFAKTTLPANIYAQGSATIDINRDGWLDYFVANDVGYSRFYINDKKGKLQFGQVIDFQTGDATDGSGNYGIEWTDVNNDGLPDLYISKCRAGVENPADLRRINRLYMQQADGTFVDRAKEYGVASGDQSWAATFGDIDNDGDQDLFLANHYAPHQLFENVEGKKFVPVDLGVSLQSFVFQLMMRDFDNDGWLDILYTGAEGATLLHNTGSFHFERIPKPLGPNLIRSFTCGDVNDDGVLDIHAHLCEPINEVGPKDDEFWLGTPNGNQALSIVLRGKQSNASGIGSRLVLHGPWGRQARIVKGGEGYGVCHSLKQHFGLGNHTMADSLEIFWPAGGREVYYALQAGNAYLVQEGRCASRRYQWDDNVKVTSNTLLASLNAPDGFTEYTWNSGATTQSVMAKPGIWWLQMEAADGCLTVSEPLHVIPGCFDPDAPLLSEATPLFTCSAQPVAIGSKPAASYQWSTGATTQWIETDRDGWLTLTATDYCGTTKKDSVLVIHLQVPIFTVGDTVLEGQKATLVADNSGTVWYSDAALSIEVGKGDTLITAPLSQSATYFAQAEAIVISSQGQAGETVFPSTNLYGANSVMGGLVFNVESDCIVRSVRVNTDTEGRRRILITARDGKVVFSKDVQIKTGISTVELNAKLVPGEGYVMTCDESVNLASFGYRSPRLVRTINTTRFPYDIEDVLSIQSSTFGALYYYYFYDWEVEFDLLTCKSPVVPVEAMVLPSATEEISAPVAGFVFPNPTSETLFFKWPGDAMQAHFYNAQGTFLGTEPAGTKERNVSQWPAGIYYVQLVTASGNPTFCILKL